MKVHTSKPQEVITSALDQVAAVMLPTYGPAGKGSLLDQGYSQVIADDGYMVLDKFEVENELENTVIKYIREAARKTNSRAGDGTTTAFIILNALVKEAFGDKFIIKEKTGISQEQQLRAAVKKVAEMLRAQARQIETVEDLAAIAKNSYNNSEVAQLIAESVHTVGKQGKVTVEISDSLETEAKITLGLSVDRGYMSPLMAVNTNGIVELNNPIVFITDGVLSSIEELTPFVEAAVNEKRDLFIVAEDVMGDALQVLIINKLRNTLNSVAIKAPGFGDHKIELLEDIAIVTGGTVISEKKGKTILGTTAADWGGAKKIKVTQDETVFVEGSGSKEAIDRRVEEIQGRIAVTQGSIDKDRLEQRVARLAGGVAVMMVGAPSEAEAKTMKLKVEDAVNATHLAYKEGVIGGGGKILAAIESGSPLLDAALKAPRTQLVKNGEYALTDDAVDPVGVVIAAIESAVSVALALITCGSIIAEKREKKKDE